MPCDFYWLMYLSIVVSFFCSADFCKPWSQTCFFPLGKWPPPLLGSVSRWILPRTTWRKKLLGFPKRSISWRAYRATPGSWGESGCEERSPRPARFGTCRDFDWSEVGAGADGVQRYLLSLLVTERLWWSEINVWFYLGDWAKLQKYSFLDRLPLASVSLWYGRDGFWRDISPPQVNQGGTCPKSPPQRRTRGRLYWAGSLSAGLF